MTRKPAAPVAPHGAHIPGEEAAAPVVPTGLGPAVIAHCRLALATWPRRGLVILTLLAGAIAAVAVMSGTTPNARSIAAVSGPVQSLMSVTLPFLGVLLVQDLWRPTSRSAVVSTVLAALVVAVLVAVFGITVSLSMTAVAYSQTADGQWGHAGTVVYGSLLVQVLAQVTGTGLGLLVRRPAVACLLTVVLPQGLSLLLGALDALRPVAAWVTPYASARNLLSGDMSPINWVQWLVVLATWGIGLNLIGFRRAS